jgi:hypothetical protein
MKLRGLSFLTLCIGCMPAVVPASSDQEITLADAQTILRAQPVGISGYPMTFIRIGPDMIIVRQTADSGQLVEFLETHDGPRGSYRFGESPAHAAFELTHERTTEAEKAFHLRQAQRRIGDVLVTYLRASPPTYSPSDLAQLMNRLTPTP